MMEPVDNTDWGTPIVPIIKPDGDLRICGDFKVTINKFIIEVKYPLPRIEEISASLQGGQLFTKLDLSNAYNQLELDDESQNLCTLSTHLGLFRVKRLPFAAKMEPLYAFLRKNQKFFWNQDANDAYNLLKTEITSEQILVHFDPKKNVVLTTDACDTAVAGILAHQFPTNELKPIAFVSRALTSAERNYSTIQKEALAIVFCVIKLYQYLIGIDFILQTDHKPLLAIFGENKGIPIMAAARMQRWAFILSGFNFKIRHVKGSLNCADALSRIPQLKFDEKSSAEFRSINFIDFENANYVNLIN